MIAKRFVLFLLLATYVPAAAHAGKSFTFDQNGCQGSWQLWLGTYDYTDEDRRNYYWIQRSFSIFFPNFSNFAGPWEVDTHCTSIGIGYDNLFRAKGCLTNDQYCSLDANYTNAEVVPKRSCKANF